MGAGGERFISCRSGVKETRQATHHVAALEGISNVALDREVVDGFGGGAGDGHVVVLAQLPQLGEL